jgi:thiamine pyrophosphokinase
MKIAVIANGEWDPEWGRKEFAQKPIDVLICADGGGNLAISSGKIPDVLIGDLDSITEENLNRCRENNTKIKKYPREKDQTDLELALEYAETYLKAYGTQEDEISLYAGAGKRLDHLLGNIALMLQAAENNRKIKMVDKSFIAWVMLSGKEILQGIPRPGAVDYCLF